MKRKILTLVLFVLVATACGTFENATIYDRKVRYFSSTILSVDRTIVTLANQSVWEVDHLATIVNLSPVFVVLEENVNVGDMYIGNQKYRIHGGVTEDFFYRFGYLQIMKSYDPKKHIITLLNDSKWEVPVEFAKFIESWEPGSEVIITEDENFIINARKQEKVPTRRIYAKRRKGTQRR
jgi:hypothetical protein